MISAKFSTNTASFNEFRGGHRIEMAGSHQYIRNNFTIDVRSFQDNSCGRNKLVHLVEQVSLYQTVYLPILVHSGFLI